MQALGEAKSAIEAITTHHQNTADKREYEELAQAIPDYQEAVAAHSRKLKVLVQRTKPSRLNPEEVAIAQQALTTFSNSEEAFKFHDFTEELTQLVSYLQVDEAKAFGRSERVDKLGQIIQLISLMVAVAIALVLAAYTSRAIARSLDAACTNNCV